MTIIEKLDNYISEASAKDTKSKIQIALDKIHFPYKEILGAKIDFEVVPKITDTTSPEWEKLEKTLERIVSSLVSNHIVSDETTITLALN